MVSDRGGGERVRSLKESEQVVGEREVIANGGGEARGVVV